MYIQWFVGAMEKEGREEEGQSESGRVRGIEVRKAMAPISCKAPQMVVSIKLFSTMFVERLFPPSNPGQSLLGSNATCFISWMDE